MLLVMKQNDIADVVKVGFFSFEAEVLQADGVPELVKQSRWLG